MGEIKKTVVIPSYKVAASITEVICSIPALVDHIIVVDDKCPQGLGKIAEAIDDQRVTVIYHRKNKGVGGAAHFLENTVHSTIISN